MQTHLPEKKMPTSHAFDNNGLETNLPIVRNASLNRSHLENICSTHPHPVRNAWVMRPNVQCIILKSHAPNKEQTKETHTRKECQEYSTYKTKSNLNKDFHNSKGGLFVL